MKKLIGMVDFVMQESSKQDIVSFAQKVYDYANFMSQKLEIWMFVPYDEAGNVLEEPKIENSFNTIDHENRMIEFQQARERCLFEGFEVRNGNWLSNGNIDIDEEFCQGLSIESLVKYNLQLTTTAQKQLSL